MVISTGLFFALLFVSAAFGDCNTCNQPQDILRGKPAVLEQFNDGDGRLSFIYFTFRGYVIERCSDENCVSTTTSDILPGSYNGNNPFTAGLMGKSVVAATAQGNGQSWSITVAINGAVVSTFQLFGQVHGMKIAGSLQSPAFLAVTGKNNGKNFVVVYNIGTSGITGPFASETPSQNPNAINAITGTVGNGGQAIFVSTTDNLLVSVVACRNAQCNSLNNAPVGNFPGVLAQQGVSLSLHNNYPVVFVSAANQPIRIAYCFDTLCSKNSVSTTTYKSAPQTSALAPDTSLIVATNNGNSVVVYKCQDAVCSADSIPVQVNGLANPLVSLIASPSGVVLVLKTLQRALLVNLCGPFPQTMSPATVTTTGGAVLNINGVGFCPQDTIARLEDYPFPARYISPNQVSVQLGPNVLPGTYQVGLQNQNGQRFGAVLAGDLTVNNGCPLNCTGHGYCNGFTSRCACNAGFSGSDCSQTTGSPCPNCGLNGVCDVKLRQCRCFNGYTGPTCATRGQGCPSGCNSHGKCNSSNGKCKCSFFWCGSDCGRIWPLCG